jgi:putative ABC transport system substrate-binding protein
MRRREFMAGLGAAALPMVARAQQSERARRVAVLMAHKGDDPEYQKYIGAFRQGLLKLGWIEGRNVRIDARWGALDDADQRLGP